MFMVCIAVQITFGLNCRCSRKGFPNQYQAPFNPFNAPYDITSRNSPMTTEKYPKICTNKDGQTSSRFFASSQSHPSLPRSTSSYRPSFCRSGQLCLLFPWVVWVWWDDEWVFSSNSSNDCGALCWLCWLLVCVNHNCQFLLSPNGRFTSNQPNEWTTIVSVERENHHTKQMNGKTS